MQPITPPRVKKFFNYWNPKPGAATIFYGKANDPDVASSLQHGVSTKSSNSVSICCNVAIFLVFFPNHCFKIIFFLHF